MGLIVLVNLSCVPNYPAHLIYEVDFDSKVCGVYIIEDQRKLIVKWEKDIPFSECPNVFGHDAKTMPAVLNWARDRISQQD